MKPEQIFIGNIRKCTKDEAEEKIRSNHWTDIEGCFDLETEPYKDNAILIKIENGGYVDIDNINSLLDHIKIRKDILREGRWRTGGLMMPTSPQGKNSLYVVQESLKSYYEDLTQEKKNISVKKLKKQIQTKKGDM